MKMLHFPLLPVKLIVHFKVLMKTFKEPGQSFDVCDYKIRPILLTNILFSYDWFFILYFNKF